MIDEDRYQALRDLYKRRWLEQRESERAARKAARERDEGGGPSYYALATMRNGRSFTRLVLSAYYTGAIYGREASSLLNVKVNNFAKLAERVQVYTRAGHGDRR